MSYLSTYHQILAYPVKPKHKHELVTFALNIILVLERSRLAYRADLSRKLNTRLLSFIRSLHPELMIISQPVEEPLVILKSNYSQVAKILLGEKDFHIGIGKVLGYLYTGPNWMLFKQDSYSLGYYIVNDANSSQERLYTFVVPAEAYTLQIQEKAQHDQAKYQSILRSYGSLRVGIETWFHPQGKSPIVISNILTPS